MNRLAVLLDTEGGVRLLWWLVTALLVAAFLGFLAVGANHPKDPSLEPRRGIAGYTSIDFSIEHGAVTDAFCALLARTDAQRSKGMMGQRDLGGYDAMLFAWPSPVSSKQVYFYNQGVPIDLSVAWFDGSGAFVSLADMKAQDPTPVRAARDYKFAIEVPKGGLGHLGIAPRAVVKVGSGGC